MPLINWNQMETRISEESAGAKTISTGGYIIASIARKHTCPTPHFILIWNKSTLKVPMVRRAPRLRLEEDVADQGKM